MNKKSIDYLLNIDILIVEDSETQANQLAELLTSNGYLVRIANSGRTALEYARAHKPTLIISDIAMPEMDGFALCRELKNDSSLGDIPVILLTALTSLHDVIRGLDSGADNFIRKPFESKNLLGRIRFILANRELRSTDRVQLGMQINLGGQTHFVTAERQQIFDLLISTYEEAIQMTDELRKQQSQIAHSYQSLEGLYKIAEALNPAITEKAVSDMALERVLDLPGVIGGFVQLLGADRAFYTSAVRNVDIAQVEIACRNCSCLTKLVNGDLRGPAIIEDCVLVGEGQEKFSSHMSVPLTTGKRTMGVMNLVSAPGTAFKDEDFQVLDTVGNQIAIALERAELYTKMETMVSDRTEALETERNRLSAVINTTGALVILVKPNGGIVTFNPACEKNLGWKSEEVIGKIFWDSFLSQPRAQAAKTFFQDLSLSADGLTQQIQQEWIARDGGIRNIIWSTSVLRRPDKSIEYVLGTGLDVTELRFAEEKVQYLSNFDVLTGLPNRILLRDQVRLAMEKVSATKNVMGFLVIRFARLPLIRESLGPEAEQELLLKTARRLKKWAKGEDNVARFADDSFAVVALRPTPEDLSTVARQILAMLDRPYEYERQDLHMDASIGISIYPNDGESFDSLTQGAEVAMRRALSSNMERYEFYRPELNRGANERFKLESALRQALARHEYLLHYQPQVDLGTGKIIGVEALLRWNHPERGLVPPLEFIGLLEETGLIFPVGEWVLREACKQSCAWREAGLRPVPMAVNLSVKQFSKNIVGTVGAVLADTGLDPTLLELELTESLSMDDPESSYEILLALKQMGVRLAIDDFGTGYSNLNYLKRFPVDKLKLDKSLVRDLASDSGDLAIARAVISMAHSLRLSVIAEGVETEGQLALLAQNGCDEIQGYLFSRPVDPAAFARLLREEKTLDGR